MAINAKPFLVSTDCAICGSPGGASELYPANFSPNDLNPEVFSARRVPDKIHFRIVRCNTCGLVRSDPVVDQESLVELYTKSSQTYDEEIPNLADSYARYLDRAVRCLNSPGPVNPSQITLLEVGCGSGFFLEKALDSGVGKVMGIEPSQQAVEKSSPRVQPHITCDILRPGLLPAAHFDLVCLFQVFDHILAPGILLDECWKAIRPGGGILCLNHDVAALSARLLGERSPIIDIEHPFLYSQATIRKIITDHGFIVLELGSATNICSLRYLFQLLPLPSGMKKPILKALRCHSFGGIRLQVKLGNLYVIAQKPGLEGIKNAK